MNNRKIIGLGLLALAALYFYMRRERTISPGNVGAWDGSNAQPGTSSSQQPGASGGQGVAPGNVSPWLDPWWPFQPNQTQASGGTQPDPCEPYFDDNGIITIPICGDASDYAH